MSDLSKNDIARVDVTDINNLGCGVGRLSDGRVIFVKGAVTGDVIDARLIKINSSYAVGKLERIIKRSPIRDNGGDCESAEGCGGCVYRHIIYDAEKEIKRSYVKHAFAKVGLSDVTVNDLHTSGRTTGYRNKAQYPFSMGKNGITAGFYALRSHNVLPAFGCLLQPSVFGEILSCVCAFANEKSLTVYDEKSGIGLLRHLYLRIGENTGEIMLCLVINGKELPSEKEFVELIRSKYPEAVSIMLNFNEKNTNVVLGKEYKIIFGRPYIEDVLCGKRFRISPESFYQVNHGGAEMLYSIVKKKVLLGEQSKPSILDLYCGTGTIGLSMAEDITELVGLEIVEGAVECARINAELNGVKNASFYAGDAKNIGTLFESVESRCGRLSPDVVVIDPPRKGCSPEVIEFIAKRNIAKVVYVSCDPDTLARDCVLFEHHGYNIGEVDPVDMFPRTGHVESVVCLSRK